MRKYKNITRALSVFLAIIIMIQVFPISSNALQLLSADTKNEEPVYAPEDDGLTESEPPQDITLGEIEELRTGNTKTFRRSKGTNIVYMYPENVHYKSDDDTWTEYDNTLTETVTDNEAEYKTASSDADIRISKKTNGKKLVRVSKDGYTLSWNFAGIKKRTGEVTEKIFDDLPETLERVGSEVIFTDVFKDTDLQYILYGDKLKENIIINSTKAPSEYTVNYKFSQLTPSLTADKKSIILSDTAGKQIFVIEAPFMCDAQGSESRDVYFELCEIKNNSFSAVIRIDSEWINAEDRVFPVTVDPLTHTSQSFGVSQSAYVSDSYPNSCFGRGGGSYEGSLYAGCSSSRGKMRSYLQFDLPSLGDGCRVVEAKLYTYIADCYPNVTVTMHRVNDAWTENTITWNEAIGYNTTIEDYKNIAPATTDTTVGFIPWDITELVDGWYTQQYSNNGVMLKAEQEVSSSYARFYSTGYTTYSEMRPTVYIEYRNMSGYESYYSFVSVKSGRGGTADVNTYNGNLVCTQPVTVDCGGEIMPVSISAIYNSNKGNPENTQLGTGWKLNYQIYIRPNPTLSAESTEAERKYKYYIDDADGTQHYFYFKSDNITGVDEDGLGYTITVNESVSSTDRTGIKYTITDKDKNVMQFNGYGNIIAIKDPMNNTVAIFYESVYASGGYCERITGIADGANRQYTFSYYPGYPVSLNTITDPAGRVTFFSQGGGKLLGIGYSDSETVYYNYSSETGRLESVCNIDGTEAKAAYGGWNKDRVSALSCSANNVLSEKYTFVYRQNSTIVTDVHEEQKKKYVYQFNFFGQTTGIVSESEKDGTAYSYNSGNWANRQANKLLSSSNPQKTVKNYVNNPGLSRSYEDGYFTYKGNSYDVANICRDANYGYYAAGSIKIERIATDNDAILACQDVYVSPGTYTVSAFVSTNGENLGYACPVLRIQIWDANGLQAIKSAEDMQYTGAGEWKRQTLTVTVTQGQRIRITPGFAWSYGRVWVDDIQVEDGYGTGSYNLVENPEFNFGYTSWTASGSRNTVANSSLNGFQKEAIQVYSPGTSVCNLVQEIAFNGKEGDVFCAGAWIKAFSVPLDGTKASSSYVFAKCTLKIELMYNSSVYDDEDICYNEFINTWQFASIKIAATDDFNKIRLTLSYDNNKNNIHSTGFYCYAEEYGSTYSYDTEGNLVSAADSSKSSAAYGYSSNTLSSVTAPTGSNVLGSYTESTNQLDHALTTNGLRYDLYYNGNGNSVASYVGVADYAKTIEDNSCYYIVNAESGKALDAADAVSGTTCHNFSWIPFAPLQKWKVIRKNYDGEYYLKLDGYPLALNVENGLSSTGALIQVTDFSSGSASQTVKFVARDDGTFTILTSASSYDRSVDGRENPFSVVKNGLAIKQRTYFPQLKSQKWYFIKVSSNFNDNTFMCSYTSYSSDGNFISSTRNTLDEITSYNYNNSSGLLQSVTAPNGCVTSYGYNTIGNITSVSAGNMNVSYSYSDDRLSTVNAPGGTAYTFAYDAFGRRTAVSASTNILSESRYDAYGRVYSQRAGGPSSQADYIYYGYDALDRLSYKKLNNKYTRYYYNANGKTAQVCDEMSDSRTMYLYDLAGRVVSERTFFEANTYNNYLKSAIDYTFTDKTNQLSSVKTTSELGTDTLNITYGNLSAGQMPDMIYSESRNNSPLITRTYDEIGRPLGTTVNGNLGYTYLYKYVGGNRTTALVRTLQTPSGNLNYTYDSSGNILSVSDGNNTSSYEYDALNQLVRENIQSANKTYVYTYSNGNITSRKEYAYTTGTPGTCLDTDTWYYGNSTWTDLMTRYNDSYVSYDLNGTPVVYDGACVDWQAGRQMSHYYNIGKNSFDYSYEYDVNGRRLSKDINGTVTEFIYAGDMLLGQKTGNDKLSFIYDSAGEYHGFTYNSTPYYYVKNLQGDVTGIANSNGTVIAGYTYDAWGNILSTTDNSGANIAAINPIRYRGYYYDTETGFYSLQSRYYDPETGRFINADNQVSTGSDMTGMNLFAYCGNNPVMRMDPTGHAWWHWALAAVVVVACVAATVVTCGGSLAGAATAIGMVASGGAAFSTASTVAAAATIGSATYLGMAAMSAAANSSSVSDFNDQGNWGTVAGTAGSAVLAGGSAYLSTRGSSSTSSGRGTQNPKVKAAVQKGQAMHKQMDYGPGTLKEVTIAPKCRVDGIDFNNNIIYELKPNNPQAISRGLAQLDRYTAAASQQYGGEWTGVLKLYD